MRKLTVLWLALGLVALLLAGCGGAAKDNAPPEKKTIKVGVSAGPHAEIMEEVKKVAAKDGLEIQIVEFNDYMTPNIALSQGDIDANSYQHQPWLDNQIKDRKYEFVAAGKTVIFPMGIYSKSIKQISELKDGAAIGIPNDPANSGRALALLEKAGVIKLKQGVGIKATVADIVENPKHVKISETRCGANSPLLGRLGCGRYQHELCHRSGADSDRKTLLPWKIAILPTPT